MRRWALKPFTLATLLGVLSVIVLVLVLPQADLLDTAFHRGTAPSVLHSRSCSRPATVARVMVSLQKLFSWQDLESRRELGSFPAHSTPGLLPILHPPLRC